MKRISFCDCNSSKNRYSGNKLLINSSQPSSYSSSRYWWWWYSISSKACYLSVLFRFCSHPSYSIKRSSNLDCSRWRDFNIHIWTASSCCLSMNNRICYDSFISWYYLCTYLTDWSFNSSVTYLCLLESIGLFSIDVWKMCISSILLIFRCWIYNAS